LFKKWFLRIIIGIFLLIAGLFITAPADILVKQISSIDGLKLQGVTGSLLSGKIQQLYFNNISLKQLTWNLSLLSFLSGKAGSDFTITDPVFTGDLTIEQSISNITYLSDINATQSVPVLAEFWRTLKFVKPQGKLDWNDAAVSLDESKFYDADGEIVWNNASISSGNNIISLGTIYIILETEDDDLLLHISDGDSVLDVQGTLRLGRDLKYQLNIDMSENLPTDINNAVRMVARPNEQGRLAISSSGQL